MIDFLRGEIVLIESDHIVLDVHGVGYRVFCANTYAYQSLLNRESIVYIHHNVREDAIFLFGFQTRDEQLLFRRLIEVSGIGPRVALGILSGGQPGAIVSAIIQENLTYLVTLPGIGKKTAQRMVLDLKDKMSVFSFAPMDVASTAGSDQVMLGANLGGSTWMEAKEGLMSLGYSEAEVDRVRHVIQSKLQEADTVDIVMKIALQALYKG